MRNLAWLLLSGSVACSSSGADNATTQSSTVDGTVDGTTTSGASTSGAATSEAATASATGATSTTATSAGGAMTGSTTSATTEAAGTVTGSGGASTTASASTDDSTATTSTGGVSSGTEDTNTTMGGTTTGGTAGTTSTDCEGGKVVHFVYFVEADVDYSESQHADIEAQAYAFQEYWYEQLGVTFYLSSPVVDVIEADNDSDWYLTTPDGIHSDERWYRLGNVKNEVYEKLGIQNFDPNHRVVNYPTTRHDGHVGGNFGGAWMDGDDLTCMAEQGGVTYPYDDGNDAHCLGHVAHEFGHVLGLDHEGPQTDCMQFGFYNSSGGSDMCDFSADNVAKILATPDNDGWFEAEPGETCVGL